MSFCFDNSFTLSSSLFGDVKLTKNSDLILISSFYSEYGISFDIQRNFSLTYGRFRKNLILMGADMMSSVNIDNKKEIS